jgi:hypothetical protein
MTGDALVAILGLGGAGLVRRKGWEREGSRRTWKRARQSGSRSIGLLERRNLAGGWRLEKKD